MDDPDDIATTMLTKLDKIIDDLAPPRVAQVKKKR